MYSYNINDVSTLFPYRRTTIIIDGGECLVGEEGDRNVYVHTRNHSVVSLATDEIVLNVFWNKLIEKENLLSKGCSGADFLQAIHNLAERYGITDEMTKNFLFTIFKRRKLKKWKKSVRTNYKAREAKELIRREKQLGARSNKFI